MDVVTGTDTSTSVKGVDGLLAGIRRLTGLADEASGKDVIFRALAAELLSAPGADEVHVHHIQAGSELERVEVYLFDGGARIGYMLARSERPPESAGLRAPAGASWRDTRTSSPRHCRAWRRAAR